MTGSDYKYSVCLAIPASKKVDANLLGKALGKGSNSYIVALSDGGDDMITHFGLHGYETQGFVDALASGALPTPNSGSWEDNGLTAARVGALLPKLLVSIDPLEGGDYDDTTDHIAAFLDAYGLTKIETPLP